MLNERTWGSMKEVCSGLQKASSMKMSRTERLEDSRSWVVSGSSGTHDFLQELVNGRGGAPITEEAPQRLSCFRNYSK